MSLTTVYLLCALVGGTLLLCQFVLTLIGVGGDDVDAGGDVGDVGGDVGDFDADVGHVDAPMGDVDGDVGDADGHGADSHGRLEDGESPPSGKWFLGVLSFRSVTAFFAFFGVTGRLTQTMQLESHQTLIWAALAGCGAMFIIYYVMRLFADLTHEGTARIADAVGCDGSVYLRIPEGGYGKVNVDLPDRRILYGAVSPQAPVATGERVIVTRIVDAATVEVMTKE